MPYSATYRDIYHSSDGGVEQARHVFLAGNGLPERWRGCRNFTIVEIGFGLGLNFLTTWDAWRRDPQGAQRLHYISCELHPFERPDMERLLARWPQFDSLVRELLRKWPPLVPGMHRLHLDGGRMTLTLCFGDAAVAVGQLMARADAFYLDGFAPSRNPDIWRVGLFYRLADIAAPGATLATWTVAAEVREGLRRAGFETEKVTGFGRKREMLRGSHPGKSTARPSSPAGRHALVIGAGAAGSAIAERLAARGWVVEVVDSAPAAGQGASGNHAGVIRPLPILDDNPLSRLIRAGTLYGLRHLEHLQEAGQAVRWGATGALQLARDEAQLDIMRRVVDRQKPPEAYLRVVSAGEAEDIVGWPVPLGGWWFPLAGWIQPPTLCAANLAAHPENVRTHFARQVSRIEHVGESWNACDAEGNVIASAPVAILANGIGIRALEQAAALPVVPARGQVSLLAAAPGSSPRVVVCRKGYVTPEVDGRRCAGATFQVNDPDETLRAADHAANLDKLEKILPGYVSHAGTPPLSGRVGFRPASPDRLPMIGPVPVPGQVMQTKSLSALERYTGLYAVSGFGARGLVWSALSGETLASLLEDEPLPVERDLWQVTDPGRYLLKPPRETGRDEE